MVYFLDFRAKCLTRQCSRVNPKYRCPEAFTVAAIVSEGELVAAEMANDDIELVARSETYEFLVEETCVKSVVNEIINEIVTKMCFTSTTSNTNGSSRPKKDKVFSCLTCNKKFAQYVSALKHCKTPRVATVACSVCNKQIIKRNMNRHSKTHEKVPERESLYCEICLKTMSSRQKFNDHMFNKHNKQQHAALTASFGKFKCPKCDFMHCKERFVKKHYTLEHNNGLKLKCSECDYRCHSLGGMSRHKDQVHKTKDVVVPPVSGSESNQLNSTVDLAPQALSGASSPLRSSSSDVSLSTTLSGSDSSSSLSPVVECGNNLLLTGNPIHLRPQHLITSVCRCLYFHLSLIRHLDQ